MERTKKTPEQIAEEIKNNRLKSSLKEINEKLQFDIIPLNPTRKFDVGERVVWGRHKETYVREVCFDGLYYLIESINVSRSRDDSPHNEMTYMPWHDIYKYNNKCSDIVFSEKEEYRIEQLNSSIDSLLHYYYHAGIDVNVDYQREHVWEIQDKEALINSIFNNIDIGKFVMVQRNFNTVGKLYEIIDGKQRLTAITEFYEDRFPYKGVYFSELNIEDKYRFENFSIVMGHLKNPSRKAILTTFVKLNTCGRKMENKDINKVINMLENLK